MLNQLTQLDLELLGETVTHGHQEKEGCTADMNSNATNSDLVMSLESQYIMSAAGCTRTTITKPRKRGASNEFSGGDGEFPTMKRSRLRRPAAPKPVNQVEISIASPKTPKAKCLPARVKESLPRKTSTKTRRTTYEKGFFHDLFAATGGNSGQHLHSASEQDKVDPINVPTMSDSFRNYRYPHCSDVTDETAGGGDSDVERGASILLLILQELHEDNTDEEDLAPKDTFTKNPLFSPQSTQPPSTSSMTSRKSFFSTVLNSSSTPTKNPSIIDKYVKEVTTNLDNDAKHKLAHPRTPMNRTSSRRRHRSTLPSNLHPNPSKEELSPPISKPSTNPSPTPPPPTPCTPPKLCKTTGKPFDHKTTVRSTPRKRAPPVAEYVSNAMAIPTSWANISAADQSLLTMKGEGQSWDVIRNMWKETTGQDVAPSTLPNRYQRIKANLRILRHGEHAILRQVVAEVDRVQKAEKWPQVAGLMRSRGAGKYPPEYLQMMWRDGTV